MRVDETPGKQQTTASGAEMRSCCEMLPIAAPRTCDYNHDTRYREASSSWLNLFRTVALLRPQGRIAASGSTPGRKSPTTSGDT